MITKKKNNKISELIIKKRKMLVSKANGEIRQRTLHNG